MLAYFMMYNVSLSESNTFTNWASSMKKDVNLLALKVSLDNAVLEMKAIEKNMDHIPSIYVEL